MLSHQQELVIHARPDLIHGKHDPDFASAERLPTITWGRRGKSQSRHSLQLGIYDYHARVVRLHRVLDQPGRPRQRPPADAQPVELDLGRTVSESRRQFTAVQSVLASGGA